MASGNFINRIDPNKKILIIGDLMVDRYYEGNVARISPEAPVPVLKVKEKFDRPGGAANVALNIASLGLQTTLMGYVGKDETASDLQKMLHSLNIRFIPIEIYNKPTIMKVRAIAQTQQMIRIDFEDNFHDQDHEPMIRNLAETIHGFDAVILSDYNKGTLSRASDIIRICNESQKPVFVDPKGSDYSKYKGAFCLTPNFSEFCQVIGHVPDEADIVSYAKTLITKLDLKCMLVTRGENGMTLISSQSEPMTIKADAVEVYDVTGAGDTVIATLASAFVSGVDIKNATILSNIAAGLVVARKGTSTVTSSELHQRYQYISSEKEDNPVKSIRAAQSAGQTIVMTNGCFDILHSGHVKYLQQARSLGDRLVVAVNSDKSTERLKGPGRPINKLTNRMAVLNGLKSVDWVIAFDGWVDNDGVHRDDPLAIIKEIKPNVLVKGGDYEIDDIVGSKEVKEWGGAVHALSFIEGESTSSIVKRIATNHKEDQQ